MKISLLLIDLSALKLWCPCPFALFWLNDRYFLIFFCRFFVPIIFQKSHNYLGIVQCYKLRNDWITLSSARTANKAIISEPMVYGDKWLMSLLTLQIPL